MNEIDRIVSDMERLCVGFLTAEQIRQVGGALSIALRDCTITREEKALSTEFAISNAEYVNRFLVLKTVKGCSQRTIKYYRETLGKFFRNITKPMPAIEANDIRAYIAMRDRRDGVSKVSQNNELHVLRSFFFTMQTEEYIVRDPTVKIGCIKSPKRVKQPLTEMELEKIRQACRNEKQRAIVEVLYSTGCRVSELVGMDWDEITGDEVLVHGKGNKDRICYLNPRAIVALEAYKRTRTDAFPAVFIGQAANGKISERIRASSVEKILRDLGKRAGVENVHPHRFRRTAATMALRRGMPIDQVSRMLGHENIGTTQIYAITDQTEIKRSHGKYLI